MKRHYYLIRAMRTGAGAGSNKAPILLGERGAEKVPIPDDDDDMSPMRKRGQDESVAAGQAASKRERSGVVTLDVAKIRELLREQSKEIMEHQAAQLAAAMQEMESKVDKKVSLVEQHIGELSGHHDELQTRVVQLEGALAELTKLVRDGRGAGLPKTDDERRKSTLVVGGWPRESRRQDILDELREGLKQLGLARDHDQAPFCTGPRRSIALLPMPLRPNETESDRRNRMFKFVTAFAETEVLTKAGTRLWCNFSKSPEERAIAAHAALIKRVVASFDAEAARDQLDFEYKTGTVWGPHGMLCSVRLPVPPQHDHKGISVDSESAHKQWIDLGLLAKLVGKTKKQVEEAVAASRR